MLRIELKTRDRVIPSTARNGLWLVVLLFGNFIACSGSDTLSLSNQDALPTTVESTGAQLSKTPTSEKTQYTPLDRAIIYNYAEKGRDDVGILNNALEMVANSEQRSEEQRVVEDYLLLAIHYWRKDDAKRVTQYAYKGLGFETSNKKMRAYLFIYLGLSYEDKDKSLAKTNFQQAIEAHPKFYRGHYELGRIYFRKNQFPEAEAKFKQALALKKDESSIYRMLGHVYRRTEKHEEAAEAYVKALGLNPKESLVLPYLGDTLFYGLQKREEAGRIYKEAVFQNWNNANAHIALGNYYKYKREYQKAEEEFKEALRLSPGNSIYQMELNSLHTEMKEMPKGEKNYQASLKKNPDSPELRMQFGQFYLKWKKFDEAESQFKMAVNAAPENVKYISKLGWYYYKEGNYKKAEQQLNSALKVDSKHVPAIVLLGRIYQEQKKHDQAISNYLQAVKLDPQNQEAVGRLKSLQEQINPPKQESQEQKLLENVRLNPKSVQPLLSLGSFYSTKNNYVKAIDSYQKATEVDPNSIIAHYILAEVYQSQQQTDKAEKEYLSALKLNPPESNSSKELEVPTITLSMVLDKLTSIYIQQKNFKKAEELYREASKSNPEAITIHILLANLYKIQNKTIEWKQELETVRQLFPKDTSSRIYLARYYVQQEEYRKAQSLYLEILKIKPSYAFIKAELNAIDPFLKNAEQSAKPYTGMPKEIKQKLRVPVGEGWSPLHFAAARGEIERVQKLLDEGADIESKNEHGRTPLYVAAKRGKLDVIKLLLKKGANVNIRDGIGGYSPLHVAAGFKHTEVVGYLLTQGAHVDARTFWGDTVLITIMYDVWHGDSIIPEILVRHGADIRATNKFGCQAICFAAQEGNPFAVKFLLEQGVNPDWKNSHGATPLYLAVSSNRHQSVQALLEGGADPRVDVDGITPLELAQSLKYKRIVNIFQTWDPKKKTRKVSRP